MLVAVIDRDFDVPLPGAPRVLAAAKLIGLVRVNPYHHADEIEGTEADDDTESIHHCPLLITTSGRAWLKARGL